MKKSACVLTMGALLLLLLILTGTSSQALDSHIERALRLAFVDDAGLAPKVVDATKVEAAAILADAGIRIEWVEPGPALGQEKMRGYVLMVILLAREPTEMGVAMDGMGVSFEQPFPPLSVYMFDPVIQKGLRHSGDWRPRLAPHKLGRCYAKVLVHEVVHALAPDLPHTRSGIMAASQNRRTLLATDLRLDGVSAEAAREGLDRIRNPNAQTR